MIDKLNVVTNKVSFKYLTSRILRFDLNVQGMVKVKANNSLTFKFQLVIKTSKYQVNTCSPNLHNKALILLH